MVWRASSAPARNKLRRLDLSVWTRENLDPFDALEITVDHCLAASSGAIAKSP
jgi:hypothetical protein